MIATGGGLIGGTIGSPVGQPCSNDPLRPRWRTWLGSILFAQVLLMPIVFLTFIGSTPYPESGVGVTAEAGDLHIRAPSARENCYSR